MKPVLLPVPGDAVGRFVLLELMTLSRSNDNRQPYITLDCKVSCETKPVDCEATETVIPDAIRQVLNDDRAATLTDILLASGALRVFIDVDALERRCKLIGRQWRDEHLLLAFVRAQASVPMIRHFFRTATRTTIARLRREEGISPPTKPRIPTIREADALLECWHNLPGVTEPRERYLALHAECGGAWSLASLFAVVNGATIPDDAQSRQVLSPDTKELHHVRHAPRPAG
ncbi:hypothetical protein NE850_18965 [Paraburkholderia sp. USG1]|uniref:hypothetical protein n=1 Tax=Paraburkholderia sp. USG1 TaxID=2952268 RepID=UPI002854FBF8|nr:hypothetical protein [Paraburkholderia sp. USG1]MDR8398425.1 hypothetical protein [Paraburkholderia sp. USG1]